MPKRMVTMRLDPDLAEWARTALGGESGRTALVEGLLRACRDGRIAASTFSAECSVTGVATSNCSAASFAAPWASFNLKKEG